MFKLTLFIIGTVVIWGSTKTELTSLIVDDDSVIQLQKENYLNDYYSKELSELTNISMDAYKQKSIFSNNNQISDNDIIYYLNENLYKEYIYDKYIQQQNLTWSLPFIGFDRTIPTDNIFWDMCVSFVISQVRRWSNMGTVNWHSGIHMQTEGSTNDFRPFIFSTEGRLNNNEVLVFRYEINNLSTAGHNQHLLWIHNYFQRHNPNSLNIIVSPSTTNQNELTNWVSRQTSSVQNRFQILNPTGNSNVYINIVGGKNARLHDEDVFQMRNRVGAGTRTAVYIFIQPSRNSVWYLENTHFNLIRNTALLFYADRNASIIPNDFTSVWPWQPNRRYSNIQFERRRNVRTTNILTHS